MSTKRRSVGRRRTSSRRWHIPPPLVHGPDTLEGGAILNEWAGEIGVMLWQASRDVMLWTAAGGAARGQLFSPGAAKGRIPFRDSVLETQLDPKVHAALLLFDQLVERATTIREEQVARACKVVSEWASDQGCFATALAFAQNAALTATGDAAAAFWVATVAVRLNDHPRAEVWFRRAVGLARQSRDWRMYSRAFGGLGNLYMRRGNLPAARRLHTRALRGARRGGMRREQAAALHDLFAVAVEMAQPLEAERLARLALDAYGRRNRRVHVLAHDVAYYWMEQGHFARALSVFQAVLPLIERPLERLFVHADVARAAGGCKQNEIAEAAAAEARRLAQEPELEQGAARAMLEVARAYVSLGDPTKAEAAAHFAFRSATAFRESRVRFAAEALIGSLRSTPASPQAARLAAPADPDETGTGDALAADFVRTLEAIATQPQ